jgi:hypothetical protein
MLYISSNPQTAHAGASTRSHGARRCPLRRRLRVRGCQLGGFGFGFGMSAQREEGAARRSARTGTATTTPPGAVKS